MMAIDRLSAWPFDTIRHVSAADEARIDLTLAALELERHQETHRDGALVAA